MSLMINCARCREPIEITDEQLDEFTKLGQAIDVAHEVCPRDREVKPAYRVTIAIRRYPSYADATVDDSGEEFGTLLSSVGTTIEAPSFVSAYDEVVAAVNEQLTRARPLAALAESDLGND